MEQYVRAELYGSFKICTKTPNKIKKIIHIFRIENLKEPFFGALGTAGRY